MSRLTIWTIICLVAVIGIAVFLRLPLKPQALNIPGPPAGGQQISEVLGEIRGTAFVTLSPHCPISNSCIPKVHALQRDYSPHGIRFVGVVPGAAASSAEVQDYIEKFSISFEVIHDADHAVCRQNDFTHTPQAALISTAGNRVYSGRIDDQWTRVAGAAREPRDATLRRAIEWYLNGTGAAAQSTEPVGCLIEELPIVGAAASSQPAAITYSQNVAPILFDNCAHCHRPGEAAPFSLLTWQDAMQHARQIALVATEGLMPPWKPVSDFGRFRNEHRLSEEEIRVITTWVAEGTPEGDPSLLPAVPGFASGWQLGQPDMVFELPVDFEVPADGPDIYQHFVLPTSLTENRLVRAIEFRPGAAEVVHHAFVYFDTTGQGRKLDEAEPGPGYNRIGTPGFRVSGSLGGWGPGGLPQRLPAGMGLPLPANADLLVQIHYHPSGRRVSDRSRVGLYFADGDVEQLVTEILVADVDLEIPAGEREHHHRAEWTLPVDTILIDATPHMHTLGRKIRAEAFLPSGERVPLIRIDDWDFYWQDTYAYENPIGLPAGTRIVLDCWYDNSDVNPLNPSQPPRTVRWGDFSDDEMGICYFRVTTTNLADFQTLNRESTKYFDEMWQRFRSRSANAAPRGTSVRQ